jgi:peroxiredoxin
MNLSRRKVDSMKKSMALQYVGGAWVAAVVGSVLIWGAADATATDASATDAVASAEAVANHPAPVLLQMMRNDAIFEHLNVSSAARAEITKSLDQIDGPWWRSRLLAVEKQAAEVDRLTAQLRSALSEHLSPSQRLRVEQLERQAILTPDDQPRIALLSPAEILSTYGKPFDFSSIKRTLPRAPELIVDLSEPANAESAWISGNSTTLRALRGRVVAVHFYAYQCINCVRNLPHYQAWHDELADQGLVVLGIQTPETARERDAKFVKRAAGEAGITYPVLMDPQSKNWDAWGNTMWPTVYLIDKQGYIRAWWQGEMNWEGKPGEQTMREMVKKLLAE